MPKVSKEQPVSTETTPSHYDRGIIPAETAARQEREQDTFMETPSKEHDESVATDDQTDEESIDTTAGYTVDREGLLNNYAIEPEMYINEPGDLRQKEQEEDSARERDLANLNQDEKGKLTMEGDSRPKGPGLI